MLVQNNLLRLVRMRSHLTQGDIAAIFQISDFANVSRWEQGQRLSNVETLMSYHLLFDMPVEKLFERHKEELVSVLIPRIRERIEFLKAVDKDEKVEQRIGFLTQALERLTSSRS